MGIDEKKISYIEERAQRIRIDIVEMAYRAGPERKAHPGPALSAADIVAALYFEILHIDPQQPDWSDRDRFILSKGHAAPVLYAALANRGYFDRSEYASLRCVNGMLQGHPDMRKTPGVDMTAGSLGHGLAAGLGMALSARIDRKTFRTFVLLGDGECQEGLVWEAAMPSAAFGLNHLTAIVDANEWQSCGRVDCTVAIEPLADKWRAFGWNAVEIDGHDVADILHAFESVVAVIDRPTVIIAHTVKGKGVSFMENDNSWHQKAPDRQQYLLALEELGGDRVV